jgi:hypothetical protein
MLSQKRFAAAILSLARNTERQNALVLAAAEYAAAQAIRHGNKTPCNEAVKILPKHLGGIFERVAALPRNTEASDEFILAEAKKLVDGTFAVHETAKARTRALNAAKKAAAEKAAEKAAKPQSAKSRVIEAVKTASPASLEAALLVLSAGISADEIPEFHRVLRAVVGRDRAIAAEAVAALEARAAAEEFASAETADANSSAEERKAA